jgi:hypothetical protein
VNLEELVQAALTTQASAEPEEAGAYDRFLRHRRRRAWRAAGSAGLTLALVLVLALAVGGAWLVGGRHQQSVTGPATTGIVRYPAQGFALTLPAGWEVDQELTRGYHRVQQEWLVLAPVRRDPQAGMLITIHTEVAAPPEYPGRPGTWKDLQRLPPTQGIDGLTGLGRRSSGRRADGRPFAAGTQHSTVTYMIAWPYHCPGQAPCPPAARWRVLHLEGAVQGAGWPDVQRVVRHLVETVQPITNALAGGPFQPEEPGLFGEPLTTLASGGQGDYVWEASGGRWSAPHGGYWVEVHFPKFKGMGSSLPNVPGDLRATMMCVPQKPGLIYGAGPQTVVTVRVELAGRPAVTVPTAVRDKNLPFTVWVLAPLPRNVQVRAVIGLDAAGRQVGRPAKPDGATGAVCRA